MTSIFPEATRASLWVVCPRSKVGVVQNHIKLIDGPAKDTIVLSSMFKGNLARIVTLTQADGVETSVYVLIDDRTARLATADEIADESLENR